MDTAIIAKAPVRRGLRRWAVLSTVRGQSATMRAPPAWLEDSPPGGAEPRCAMIRCWRRAKKSPSGGAGQGSDRSAGAHHRGEHLPQRRGTKAVAGRCPCNHNGFTILEECHHLYHGESGLRYHGSWCCRTARWTKLKRCAGLLPARRPAGDARADGRQEDRRENRRGGSYLRGRGKPSIICRLR